MARPNGLGLEHTWRTRSRAEGDSRSAAKKCGSMKACLADRGSEATPQRASVSSDRSIREASSRLAVRYTLVSGIVSRHPWADKA